MTYNDTDLKQLIESYNQSPHPSFKVSNYFKIYSDLFKHLRGTECTFIETGILNGGSLFMWRRWLGDQARIIGVDLNPEACKWRNAGFEIFIGDQGDPLFWRDTFQKIGEFDALLDDGGHQSFQQIVTLTEAISAAQNSQKECVVGIEDTCTSFMKEFSRHGAHSFLEYAKDATDNLLVKNCHFFPGEFPPIDNPESADQFKNCYSIEFFSGIVAFKIKPTLNTRPELVWNHAPNKNAAASDFRYEGLNAARVDWPNPFCKKTVVVRGGSR